MKINLQKYLMFITLLTSLVLLSSCTQVDKPVTAQFAYFENVPVEVDLFEDVNNSLKVIVLPEAKIKAEVKTAEDSTIIDQSTLPGITITSYKVTFAYQDTTFAQQPLPEYSAKTSIHIKANETISFGVNFMDDNQWQYARTIFQDNNCITPFGTTVTVTFYGQDDVGNDFQMKTNFTALFGEFGSES